jgi:hypothetical protein
MTAIVVLLVIFLYGRAYKTTVRAVPYGAAGMSIVSSHGPENVPPVVVLPQYTFRPHRLDEKVAAAFFAPANWVDRWLRPRLWDPKQAEPVVVFAFMERAPAHPGEK